MRNTLMNVDNIDESIEYIDTIHGESKGWITKAEISKQREFSQWHYYVEDLLKQDFDKEDVYISMSTFYKPMRRIENIKELTCNFIDLDTYNTKFTKTQILMNKDKQYKYKNETLIELLEISDYEQTHMKIIIGKEEYKRRDREYQKNKYLEKLKSEGKISEKEKISRRRQKIKALLAEGLLQKDICNKCLC